MQLLPPLITAHGSFALPLSDQAAEQMLAALSANGAAGLAAPLALAIEHDASLALWTLCRAAQRGQIELGTLEQLAQWLAAAIYEELRWPQPGDETPLRETPVAAATDGTPKRWAKLAAQSQGIAGLAARLAVHYRLNRDRACLLGLLHAAPQWLESAGCPSTSPSFAGLLPRWLTDALAALQAHKGDEISSVEHCVALAVRMSGAKPRRQARPNDFRFKRRRHAADVAGHRKAWSEPSKGAIALPAIIGKLARLQILEQEFRRTLEAEKLDSLKELAYGAGHEINNPLANISARAQTLLELERDPDRRRLLAAINAQAFRAHEMIADMMLFARPPEPRFECVDLLELARAVVRELTPQAAAGRSELLLKAPGAPVMIRADKTQIAVALRAVCVNALEALVDGGRVEVELREPASLCKNAQITISDNGPGIPEEARRHIFDPFYSGREAGRGLGFGLSKCWRIVTMHGGRIEVASSPGEGARFTISLPKSDSG